jgi:hypothetical protein
MSISLSPLHEASADDPARSLDILHLERRATLGHAANIG